MSVSHQRKALRQKVCQLLRGQTTAEDRVYSTRVVTFLKKDLRAINVYATDETVDADSVTTAPRELTRELELVIEGYVPVIPDPETGIFADDVLDDFAAELEAVMDANRDLDGTCGESILESTTLDLENVGDRIYAIAVLTYRVTYRTPDAPTLDSFDDFNTVGATHQPEGFGDGEAAEDVFTVQEAS